MDPTHMDQCKPAKSSALPLMGCGEAFQAVGAVHSTQISFNPSTKWQHLVHTMKETGCWYYHGSDVPFGSLCSAVIQGHASCVP